jgi:hypothetical protein
MKTHGPLWLAFANLLSSGGCSAGDSFYCSPDTCSVDFDEPAPAEPEVGLDVTPSEPSAAGSTAAPDPVERSAARQQSGEAARWPDPAPEPSADASPLASPARALGIAGASFQSAAWSPRSKRFALAMTVRNPEDDRLRDLLVTLLDEQGVPLTPKKVEPREGNVAPPRIASGDGNFGVVWSEYMDGNSRVYFQRVSAVDGSLVDAPSLVSDEGFTASMPDVAFVPGRGWFVTYVALGGSDATAAIQLRRIDTDGSAASEALRLNNPVIDSGLLPRIVAGPDAVTVSWYTADPVRSARFRSVSGDLGKGVILTLLATGDPTSAAPGAVHPVVARREKDIAVGWTQIGDDGDRRVFLDVYDLYGTAHCRSQGTSDVGMALDVIADDGGYAVVTGGASVARFDATCAAVGRPRRFMTEDDAILVSAQLTASDEGTLLAWTEQAGTRSRTYTGTLAQW